MTCPDLVGSPDCAALKGGSTSFSQGIECIIIEYFSPSCGDRFILMAREEEQSIHSAPDKALERSRREKFLRAANADYAALRCDSAAWKRELREREVWEQTVADGLAEE